MEANRLNMPGDLERHNFVSVHDPGRRSAGPAGLSEPSGGCLGQRRPCQPGWHPVIKVDRYEIPFRCAVPGPEGHTKKRSDQRPVRHPFHYRCREIYVQLTPSWNCRPERIGHEGDPVLIEALVIPGEAPGGYPGVLVFSAQMAVSPKSGQPNRTHHHRRSALYNGKAGGNSYRGHNSPDGQAREGRTGLLCQQPAVHNGYEYRIFLPSARLAFLWPFQQRDEFEVLIQALPDEFLLPELAPVISLDKLSPESG